jgi:signal transduction histidine kinase
VAANAELEQRVADRTAALEEIAAEVARSNDRLQEFVRIVAHDLKNPLVVIGLTARRLVRTTVPPSPPEAQTPRLQTIADTAYGALSMIDDLLAYSQASADIPPERVSLDQQVKRAIAAVKPLLDEYGAKVETPGPLPTVIGNPVALHHVFRNLLVNAATYHHPDRPPVITITAEDLVAGGWHIVVADNGIGIPPDQRDAVFTPGVRLGNNDHAGSGLGLAAVRNLVEAHGGRITAHANPDGPGTRFVIELPAGVHRADRADHS